MTRIAVVYAQALYDLAREEGVDALVLQELLTLKEAFCSEPDFIRLLATPSISKQERCQIIENSFGGKVHAYLQNFLMILTEKGYISQFCECADAYTKLYQDEHGILTVNALTAVALTPEQSKKLCEKLAKITGKTIELHNQIDPSCLGGIRLDYDGKRVDDTLVHRLDALHGMLKNTIL